MASMFVPEWESRIGRRLRLRDLHILYSVVQWGSMAKAAAHLRMSQPSVSEAIAKLEGAVGVRLLDRSPRGIEPTIYANALLKRGAVVFDELRQGIRDIEFLADPAVGEVRIGCSESLMMGFCPPLSIACRVDIRKSLFTSLTCNRLRRSIGNCETATSISCWEEFFKPLEHDEIDAEVLFEDRYLIVAGQGVLGRAVARFGLQSS